MSSKLQGKARQYMLEKILWRCTIGAHNALMERADCTPDEFLALARRAAALAGQGEILRAHVEQAAGEKLQAA